MNSNVHVIAVTLELNCLGNNFKSESDMLDWVQACLNCNSNHVVVTVNPSAQSSEAVAEPVVVINMDGGLINNFVSTIPIRDIVLDGDFEVPSSYLFEVIFGGNLGTLGQREFWVRAASLDIVNNAIDGTGACFEGVAVKEIRGDTIDFTLPDDFVALRQALIALKS